MQRPTDLRPSAPRARARFAPGPFAAGVAAALLLAAGGCRAAGPGRSGRPVPLGEETFDAWRDYVVGDGADEAWRAIPWRTSFADGLRDAAREEKPLLLWGMNGHPLGAT